MPFQVPLPVPSKISSQCSSSTPTLKYFQATDLPLNSLSAIPGHHSWTTEPSDTEEMESESMGSKYVKLKYYNSERTLIKVFLSTLNLLQLIIHKITCRYAELCNC